MNNNWIEIWEDPEEEGGKPTVHVNTGDPLNPAAMISATIEISSRSMERYGRSPARIYFSPPPKKVSDGRR